MSILKHPDNYKRIAGANARRIAELSESKKPSGESKKGKKPEPAPDAAPEESDKNPYLRALARLDSDNDYPRPR